VSLLWKGPESFHIIFDEMRWQKAICSPIFRNDETGNELMEILKAKPRKGQAVHSSTITLTDAAPMN
jgi:hypothetical protein